MTKPSHFREVSFQVCGSCKHRKLTYHHCSCCSADDEYTCTRYAFVLSDYDMSDCVCNDYEEDK